jgi:hypothetical protein
MADICCRGGPTAIFVGDVIFDPRARVDFQFARVHGSTETGIDFSCVDVVCIVFRIVNMLFWSVDA